MSATHEGTATGAERPEGFRRVSAALAQSGHPHAPVFLEVAARTAQEAAQALGIAVGQIAKSVVFRRKADDAAVLVVTSGDKRVDERKVAALVGAIGRADADFVKASTGFTIGGVAPVGHLVEPVLLIDRELYRFEEIWAAAGHPNGVFRLSPAALSRLTGAPVADVVQADAASDRDRAESRPATSREQGAVVEPVGSPCNSVCTMDARTGWCRGCLRSIDEITGWSTMNDDAKRAVVDLLAQRRLAAGSP